jgi:uncharacterized protein (DUF952 family)
MTRVYKVMAKAEWTAALAAGRFDGAAVDLADGFIHLSAADQAAETLRRHFAGREDLVIVAFEAEVLGPALKWEPSRGGALFPHLYAPLPTDRAIEVRELRLTADGGFDLGELPA